MAALKAGFESGGDTVRMSMDDTLRICLPESMISGYRWDYIEKEGCCVRMDDSWYAEKGVERFTGQGRRCWLFRPVKKGECYLEFSLIRPWSGATPEYWLNIDVC